MEVKCSKFEVLTIRGCFLEAYIFICCVADASMYAHYLFNAFDTANNGSIKFKVNTSSLVI